MSLSRSGAVRGCFGTGRLWRVRGLVRDGLEAGQLLVFGLIPAHLLAGEAEFRGDLVLFDVPFARFTDCLAEREARLLDLRAGLKVGVTSGDDGRHRITHLCIVTQMWPTPSVQHIRVPRNLWRCHDLGCKATWYVAEFDPDTVPDWQDST